MEFSFMGPFYIIILSQAPPPESATELYHVENETKTEAARVQLFNKRKALEALPPTSDALHVHIERAHYQTLV